MLRFRLYRQEYVRRLEHNLKRSEEQIKDAISLINKFRVSNNLSVLNNNIIEKSLSIESALLQLSYDFQLILDKEKENSWSNDGLIKLSALLNDHAIDHLEETYKNVVSFLSKYTNASLGSLYILNNEHSNCPMLELVSAFACNRNKPSFVSVHEGLLGECFQRGELVYLNNIPAGYTSANITSGLGHAQPTAIAIIPIRTRESVYGVLEFAFFSDLRQFEIDFIAKVGMALGEFVKSIQESLRNEDLRKKAEALSGKLLQSENSLKENIRDMKVIQDALHDQNELLSKAKDEIENKHKELAILKAQEEELLESKLSAQEAIHQTIVNRLKRKIEQLQQQNELTLLNQ